VRLLVSLLSSEQPVKELAVAQLARLRLYYPDDVDDVLAELDVPRTLQQQVHDRTPQESLSDLLVIKLAIFIRDAVLLNEDRFLINETQNLLHSATESTNLTQWLRLLVTRIANLVYGEPLF